MTDEHPMMAGSAAVFVVSDFDAVDADGNQVTFGMGIPGTE